MDNKNFRWVNSPGMNIIKSVTFVIGNEEYRTTTVDINPHRLKSYYS